MNIGELFIALGFDVDDQKLKEFNENLKTGFEGMLKISAAAAAALYAVDLFVDGSIRSATALRNFNTETGDSIEALQKWQIVSHLTNSAIAADQVTASFKSMAKAIADVTMGKGPVGAFAQLGVSDVRGRDVSDVMEELRRNYRTNIAKWGLKQTHDLMQSVGFDPGMLQALQLSESEFNAMSDGRILSQDQIDRLVEFGNVISDATTKFTFFKNQLIADWSPTLIKILENSIDKFADFGKSLQAIGQALRGIYIALSPEEQKLLIAFFALFIVTISPLTGIVVALALAIDQLGKALRGLPNIGGQMLLSILNLMHSEDGSVIADLKKKLEAQGNGKAENIEPLMNRAPAGYAIGNTPIFNPSSSMEQRMLRNNQIMMNNVYHIHSMGDAFEVGDQISTQNQKQISKTFSEFNNGPRY